jgi:hypothetical protein
MLCQWEDTITQNLTDRLKAIHAGLASELPKLTPDQLNERIADLGHAAGKSFLSWTNASPSTLESMKWINESGSNVAKPWRFGKELAPITPDARFQFGTFEYTENVTPVLSQEDQILFWAYTKYSIAAATMTKAAKGGKHKR